VKEGVYPYTSGGTGKRQTCDAAKVSAVEEADRVQLTGGGFRQLQQWSARTLREVRPCSLTAWLFSKVVWGLKV